MGVPPDGNFAQPNGQVTGLLLGQPGPESGDRRRHDVRRHLAAELPEQQLLDPCRLLEYQIDDVITQLDPNFSINQCVATGDPTFCDLITRFTDVNNAGIV